MIYADGSASMLKRKSSLQRNPHKVGRDYHMLANSAEMLHFTARNLKSLLDSNFLKIDKNSLTKPPRGATK